MTQKIPCTICGCSILPLTASRTGGVCRPCYYQIAGHVRVKFRLPRVPALSYDDDTIIAESVRMRGVLALVKLVAESDLPVLISGEAGTGKKLLGREIHRLGQRSGKQLVVRECTGYQGSMVVACRGRVGDCVGRRDVHPGLLERADGGTLVLGNIARLTPWDQEKLAPVFRAGEFKRCVNFFDEVTVKFDVRFVATTTPDMPDQAASGEFLQELYSYMNAFTIHVPLLRERKEDIPALLEHYLPVAADGLGLARKKLSAEAFGFFLSYPWPGNISELQAVLESSVLHSRGATIKLADLPPEMAGIRWTNVLADVRGNLKASPHRSSYESERSR